MRAVELLQHAHHLLVEVCGAGEREELDVAVDGEHRDATTREQRRHHRADRAEAHHDHVELGGD